MPSLSPEAGFCFCFNTFETPWFADRHAVSPDSAPALCDVVLGYLLCDVAEKIKLGPDTRLTLVPLAVSQPRVPPKSLLG